MKKPRLPAEWRLTPAEVIAAAVVLIGSVSILAVLAWLVRVAAQTPG